MIKYKLFSFLFVFISFLFFLNPAFAQISDTVGVVDTLRVGNINTYPGSKVCLPLYAFNDEHLGAIVIPLEFSSPDITCDSISFVGTRAASATMKSDSSSRGTDIQNDKRRVTTWAVWFSGDLPPGNGVVANLWFTIDNNALPQIVEFDTFSTSDPPVYLDFTYTWAVDMIPAFVKGTISIEEINIPPQIQPIEEQYVNEGDTLLINIYAEDPEGDTVIFSLLNSPEGASFEDSGNGSATFLWIPPYTGAWSSENSPYTVTFVASDGDTTSAQDVVVNVIDKIPDSLSYVLEIGADTGLFSEMVTVPIILTNPDSIGAMKLLINYDRTALWLLDVNRSDTRISNWEYFEPKVGIPELGDITILAQAEKASYVEDFPKPLVTPPMPPGSGVIANLVFQIILDPYYQPIDIATDIIYKFTDSTDNTLNSASDSGFIGQDDIEYKNGYVLILNPGMLLGDLNLNGIPFEVGDAVVFSNFLIDPNKYPFNEQQKLNSDINEDGICCSLADFIELLKHILEGKNPVLEKLLAQSDSKTQVYIKTSSSAIDFYVDSKVPVGGALLVIGHSGIDFETPILSSEAEGMTLLRKDYSEELRLLIYSPTARYIEPGRRKILTIPIVEGDGNINIEVHKASISDNLGNLMDVQVSLEEDNKEVPSGFSLLQNYPNPFNPQTNISFTLPEEGEVNLKIYNLKGQLVKVMVNRRLESGLHTFIWDGKDNSGKDLPSGIYFYKLTADKYSKAMKMIKIK